MNKTRALTLLLCAAAAAIYVYSTSTGLHPLAADCLLDDGSEDICLRAYATDSLSDEERGRVAFHLGRLSDKRGDWETALGHYDNAIALFPNKITAFYERGSLLSRHKHDFPAALRDYDIFLHHRPDDLYGLVGRAETYRLMESYDLADADLNRAALIAPDDRYLLRARADLLQDLENDEAALIILDGAIEKHPAVMGLWQERSWVKRQLGDYAGAVTDIGHVIANDPKTMWPWYQRGWLNIRLGHDSAGLTDLQEALALDPNYGPARREMRRLLEGIQDQLSSDPSGVIAFADAGLINEPQNLDLLYLRAIGQSQTGQFIGAINDMNAIIAATEFPFDYIFARSAIYLQQGQFDLALADLDYLTSDPSQTQDAINTLSSRISILEEAGQNEAANKLVGNVGDLAGLYAVAMRAKIQLHHGRGHWQEAFDAVETMTEHDPDDSNNWSLRGEILERLGRESEALESYSAAIRLAEIGTRDLASNDSARANALLRRGALYQSQSRADAAQADFDAALQGENAELILAFQQKMQSAGYYQGQLSGNYDAATQAALQHCAADPDC
ncbi:tetratricopeptide repeat protein [Yoonia sp. BS5-3]|uniref:Tetratricopeptide repeat protein n=1 Tax=Yoonia phaeophyticola TaxID=3137369 RepID=A0ABZ2V3Q0_9RHOB